MIKMNDISEINPGIWFRIFYPICKWFHKHFFFSKAALFISGLVFSYSMVEYAVVSILLDYLSDVNVWGKQNLAKATAIINFQDGLSTVSAVIVAHIADSCIGRFKINFICTIAYIVGLVLVGYATNVGIYVGLLAIALGKSGRDPVLKAFLADQLSGKQDLHKDEEKIEARRKVWWYIPWFFGAIIAIFLPSSPKVFLLSILVMGANFLFFWLGFSLYHHQEPVQSPLNACFRVFKAAISKRHLSYPSTPNQFYQNHTGEIPLSPEVPLFRWLDKAAIIEERPLINLGEQESCGMLCTVKNVSDVKRLLTLMPMWANFSAYCLIAPIGDTSFVEQSNNLESGFLSLSVLFFLRSFIRLAIKLPFGWEKVRQKCGLLMRIGAGMVCSIACCIVAWQVEVHRLHLMEEMRSAEDIIPMSVYSLIPQYLLLGLMEGLAEDGLEEFVIARIPDSMRRYGPVFTELVLGFGYFYSIPLLFLFRSFGDTNHLEIYFLFLAILSSFFLVIYVLSLSKYARMVVIPSEDIESDKCLEDGARESIELKPTSTSSSVRWRRLAEVATTSLATLKATHSTKVVPDDKLTAGTLEDSFVEAENSHDEPSSLLD